MPVGRVKRRALVVLVVVSLALPGCAGLREVQGRLASGLSGGESKAELRRRIERLEGDNAELRDVARRVIVETLEAQVEGLIRMQSLRALRDDEKAELLRAHNRLRYVRGEIGEAPGEPAAIEPEGGGAEPGAEDGAAGAAGEAG